MEPYRPSPRVTLPIPCIDGHRDTTNTIVVEIDSHGTTLSVVDVHANVCMGGVDVLVCVFVGLFVRVFVYVYVCVCVCVCVCVPKGTNKHTGS